MLCKYCPYFYGFAYLELEKKQAFLKILGLQTVSPSATKQSLGQKQHVLHFHELVNKYKCFCNNREIIDQWQHPLSDKREKC